MDILLRNEILRRIRKPKLRIEKAVITTEAYKKTEGEPMIIRRAKVLYELANKIPIAIEDWQLLVGTPSAEPFTVSPHPEASWRWVLTELDALSTREGDKYEVTENDKEILRSTLPYWKGKSFEDVILNMLPEDVHNAYHAGLIDSGYISQGSGNFSPDYQKVINKGFSGIKDEIEEKMAQLDLANPMDYERWLFYKAALLCCNAVIKFAGRYAALAKEMAKKEVRGNRRNELLLIAQNCDRVPEYPAKNFYEALQAFWLTHVFLHFEAAGGAGIVPGRLDQYLYPFKNGIPREEMKRWLENLWLNYNQIILFLPKRTSLIWSGNPISEQPTIGGMNENEEDACNEITELILEVEREVRLPQPDIALMYHKKISDRVLSKACEILPLSMKPKFFNYDIATKQLISKGATVDDIKKGVVVIGCVTSAVAGKTWGNNNMAFVNLGKCLEITLNNGIDPLTGIRIGISTGDITKFISFNELIEAFKKQLQYSVRMAVILSNVVEKVHSELNPQPLAGILIDDHLERGIPPWRGGAKYNIPGIEGVGFATVTDSLAAIKKLVFENQKLTISELKDALNNNFEGNLELLRQRLINEAPKFGNDDDYVDMIAQEIAVSFCDEVRRHNCCRRAPYYPGLYSVSAHIGLGRFVNATPDGRKANSPLSDGMSPSQGVCFNGPTAVIKSLTKLDHSVISNGTLLNMKFSASLLKGTEKVKKFIDMLRTFMDLGGYHVQFNMIDTETLKDAQIHPDKYSDLLVRVAAYVAQFGQLPKDLQDDIISRSELGSL